MTDPAFEQAIADVRRFNRFYTRQIGLLNEGLLDSTFSLSEVRVLYELAHREAPTAAELGRALQLDPGYLSRMLRGFADRGLVVRTPSATDGRQSHIALTPQGRSAFAPLERASRDQIAAMLAGLSAGERTRLLDAMGTVERLLGSEAALPEPYVLRPHRPGDMGWVVHRHGVLYAREYGWDERFEAVVADIAAQFIRNFDPARECCWIAERAGAIVGSVLLVRAGDTVARLRLLLVEPEARGLGIGRRLVAECTRFARRAGYERITLWTNSNLEAARRIYARAGYRLVQTEPHESFGHALVGETWELRL